MQKGLSAQITPFFNGFIKKLNFCRSEDILVLGYCTMNKLVILNIQYNHNKQNQTVNKYNLH